MGQCCCVSEKDLPESRNKPLLVKRNTGYGGFQEVVMLQPEVNEEEAKTRPRTDATEQISEIEEKHERLRKEQ